MSQFLQLHYFDELMPPEMPRTVVINFGLVIGAAAIILLGLWDDIIHMSPKVKILGQVFAAACLLMGGIGRRCSWILVGPVLTKLASHGIIHSDVAHLYQSNIVLVASWIMVIGIIVVCCNATNL